MDVILERIIDELKQQNKKQYELTDYLGLTHNAFGNWKAGKNSSYKKYLHGIAEFLGVSVEYLRGETDKKTKPSTVNGKGQKENTVRIAGRDGTFVERQLTDEQADLLRRMIEQMPEFED